VTIEIYKKTGSDVGKYLGKAGEGLLEKALPEEALRDEINFHCQGKQAGSRPHFVQLRS
jgi:hypothetical protein